MKRIANLTLVLGAVGLLALLLLLAAGAQPAARADGNTLKVPDDYATIQAAIDAADEGDEIWVATGVYTENLSINKGLALYGGWNISFTLQTPGDSIVYGSNIGRVISITCARSDVVVRVDGFTIVGGDASGLGIPILPELPLPDSLPEGAEAGPEAQGSDARSPSERAAELRAGEWAGGVRARGGGLVGGNHHGSRGYVGHREARQPARGCRRPADWCGLPLHHTGRGLRSHDRQLRELPCGHPDRDRAVPW